MLLSQPFPAQRRLATQLVALVVLVALLSGGTVGWLVINRAREALREDILHTDLATTDLAASVAASYMTEAQGDARELTASSGLRATAATDDLASATPLLEQWLSGHPNLLGVGVVDLSGFTRATGLADKSFVNTQVAIQRDWFQGALATGEPFLGTPSISLVTQRPQVPYGIPLRDETGSMRGILIASISLEALSDTLTAVQVGPNSRTALFDWKRDIILAHVDRSRILQPSSGKNEATNRLVAGERGALENVNSTGQHMLSAFAPVTGLPWGILIQQPSEDAFRPVDEMVRQVVILIALALILAAAIGVGLAFGILRPIRQLRSALDAMAGGDLGNRVRTTRQDELGELGRGFDRMADRLQQTLTDLQESEGRFREFVGEAFDGFAIHQEGCILEANEQFAALFGYGQAAELVGRSVPDLVAREWREIVLQNMGAGVEELYEAIGLRKNETHFHMELVDKPCRYAGRPARAIAVRDVSSRKQAEEQRSRMAAMVTSSGDAIVGTAGRAIVTDWNAGAERLYGYSAREMVGRSVECLIPPECGGQMAQVLIHLKRGERTHRFETQRLRKDGTRVDVSISISAVVDTAGRNVGAVTIARDMTERKLLEEQLRRQALHDELTGLPNRTLLQDRVSHAILAAGREHTPLTLLLVDLDRFKEINDTFGHHYGDLLLQQIGPRLCGVLRASDTVARLGGDEFGILLPTTDASSAVAVAQQLLQRLEAPFELDGQPVEIGASIGVATYPAHGKDTAALLRQADIAMYVAKRGDSSIVVYAAEQDHYSAERLALGGELRTAMENNELLLHFQPQLALRDGTLVGVEALVRWQHPLRGFLPPSEFIPLAEQTGLINPLTRWVLEAALKQHQAWQAVGIDVPVAVNLSRRTLHDPELPEMVAQLLTRWEVAPGALVLEITESSLMTDPQRASENLNQLRALGVRVSIDDFGTGYSSLDSLKNLPVDELKIDQSFVQAMAVDHGARAIVRAIIDLADALGLRVVAEGVEDRATWDVLAGLGCEVAQGYFLSRPIGAAELDAWVAQVSPSWLAPPDGSPVEEALQERIRARGARLTAEEEFIARKQAEAALGASEERNRMALQAAGMGTWDVDITRDTHTWSVETEALFGLAPGTFEGTSAAYRRLVHPADWLAVETELLAAQVEHRDFGATYRVVWPDGSVHWIEERGRPLYNSDGTLVRMTGTSMDIAKRKEAEAALFASEERNRMALEAARMGTWNWDVVHNVHTWSAEAEALSGLAPGTFDGTFEAMRRVVHPDDWANFEIEEKAAQAEHRDSITTYRTVWPDGSVHWLESKGRSLHAADGTLLRVTGTAMDITERKQAEVALRASEERNRLALQAARMGTWDWDPVSNVHTWSAETEALFGLAPGTFEGTFDAMRRAVHPDDWPAFEVEERAAQAGRRDSFTTFRPVWPDGSVHWLESRGRALYTQDGTLIRGIGTCLDITERKRAEEGLKASEERFRKQYKGFPLATYSWLQVGDDFVLQDYNDAADAVTQGHIRDWLGRRASEEQMDQPELLASLRACVTEQVTLPRHTLYHYGATGQERELSLSYVFVPPLTVMVHAEDITDAKQAEQQREALAQSEKLRALGQMATGIAHDLNQSLMLVASYSDLARQALVQDPPNLVELEDLLTTSTQAALDGGESVKRLLQFTRVVPEHEGKPVELSSVVRDAAQLTAPRWRDEAQAEGRSISLHIEAEGSPTIQGSAARLRELMTNLIFNAVDALPAGGTIGLRVGAQDGQGIIEVTDSGVGMSAEVQARVFEPFFTTKGEGGAGLGLAMVFGIVEQHGGHIEVHSAPGDGTTLRITFPLVEAVVEAAPSIASAQLEAPRPLRVLTVDDEPMMTKAVVRMLKPSGHVVTVAASGEEALEKLAVRAFDVVMSDVGMGSGMNGWELADEVKRRWPKVRFLLATGWGAAIDPAEAKTRGVEAVLSKPYRPVDLLEALARPDAVA